MKWKSWSGWKSSCLKQSVSVPWRERNTDPSWRCQWNWAHRRYQQHPGSEWRNWHDQLNINCKYSHQEKAVNLGDAAIAFINGLKLLPLCDHSLQAKDAGPRVGAFKTLRCQGFNTWTHMNRIHRAPHDSGQNEAERSQAAIGQALIDGRALHWEYFQPTDLISEEELRESTHSWRNERAKRQK